MKRTVEGWEGTIGELHEWLNQFDNADTITFYGGEDGEGEFVIARINDEEVLYCDNDVLSW